MTKYSFLNETNILILLKRPSFHQNKLKTKKDALNTWKVFLIQQQSSQHYTSVMKGILWINVNE